MSEHEHAAVLEERWRTGFSRSLGALDQRVQRAFAGIAGIEEKVDRRVGGVEEQLTQLNIRLAQMLPSSAQRLSHAPKPLVRLTGGEKTRAAACTLPVWRKWRRNATPRTAPEMLCRTEP